ncbi:MAG: hypothetical protein U0359_14130 [Byssovorax sp.]
MLALVLTLAGCEQASGGAGATSTGAATSTASVTAGAGGASSSATAGGAIDPGTGGTATSTSGTTTGSGGSGGAAPPVWGADQCPATPPGATVGVETGQQLAPITVLDCDGNPASLDELCGASALWIFAASGTCPFCKSVSAQQEMIHAAYAAKNLASVNILVENGQGKPPDANDCKVWRAKFGQDKVRTYYDPTGTILALWPEPGVTSMSAFVDHDRIIVGKLVHTADLAAIMAGIQGALDN